MAQKPVLRGKVGCACVAREVLGFCCYEHQELMPCSNPPKPSELPPHVSPASLYCPLLAPPHPPGPLPSRPLLSTTLLTTLRRPFPTRPRIPPPSCRDILPGETVNILCMLGVWEMAVGTVVASEPGVS